MNNPKTTLAGYGTIGVALVLLAARFLSGAPITLQDVLTALGLGSVGAGLIGSKDGGH